LLISLIRIVDITDCEQKLIRLAIRAFTVTVVGRFTSRFLHGASRLSQKWSDDCFIWPGNWRLFATFDCMRCRLYNV